MTTHLHPAYDLLGRASDILARAAALRGTARATLGPIVAAAAGRPIALVDFPAYPNVGDSAIWAGTRRGLAALGREHLAYTCDLRTYDRATLARRVGDGTIFLLGGGNFGDLYPQHQLVREAIVRDFPRNRVVQLPQTIRYRSNDALAASRRVFAAHPDFVLLVRDEPSRRIAEWGLGIAATPCPDLALLLEPGPTEPAPEGPVLWLSRGDGARHHEPKADPSAGIVVEDWPVEVASAPKRWMRLLTKLHRAGMRGPVRAALSRCYDPLARRRLELGLARLRRSSVLVTDRLHGHVLALLLGIPHVLLDDRTGKVRAFHDAWTRGVRGVVLATDAASVPACVEAVRASAARSRAS
jgi:pyruvyl transferase EpsO